jgi:outer membrane assembly lipoprotein YfiO
MRMSRLCTAVRRRPWRLGVIVAATLYVGACKTGPDLTADYAQTAVENYERAIDDFLDHDYDECVQFADFVRIRFPFSRYAVEAELLIARAEFEQANYTTAVDAFKQFAKLHPTHEHVRNGWATYMAAAAAYMNAPQTFFLLPPDHMRDQSQLQDALVELEFYFDHYSGTVTEKFALKLRDEVRRRLLKHELYVANFYLGRDKPEAAIGRLEAAHARYPGIGLDAEVLFLLGITYLRMDEVELSRSTFTELQTQHPQHHHGQQAKVYLRYIRKKYGPTDPSRKRPDRTPPRPIPPPKPKNMDDAAHPERGRASGKPSVPAGTSPPPSSPPASSPPPSSPPPESPPPESPPPESPPPESPPPESPPPESPPPESPPSAPPTSSSPTGKPPKSPPPPGR